MWYTVVYGVQVDRQWVINLIDKSLKESYVAEEFLKFTTNHPGHGMDEFVDICLEDYFLEEESLLNDILYDIHQDAVLQYIDPLVVPECKKYLVGISLTDETECLPLIIPKPPRNANQVFSKLQLREPQTYLLPLPEDE